MGPTVLSRRRFELKRTKKQLHLKYHFQIWTMTEVKGGGGGGGGGDHCWHLPPPVWSRPLQRGHPLEQRVALMGTF